MPRPASLTVAAILVALEGLVIVVLAVFEGIHLTSGRLTMGVTTAVFFGAYGVGLLICGLGLWRRSSWGRGPAVLAQLIQLGLAWNFRGDSAVGLSVVLAGVAVVALGSIFARSSLLALEGAD